VIWPGASRAQNKQQGENGHQSEPRRNKSTCNGSHKRLRENELFHPTYHFLSASQSDTHRVCNTQKGIDTLTRNGPTHVLAWAMKPISYARHRFPPDVIRHAVWLYLRFTLSYRDVEDLLAERGLTVSNESIRRWVLKFGPVIAKNLRGTRPKPHTR